MKRFTETTKWDDPWFWGLSSIAKHLWQYLLDHCDNAGVIDFNSKLASLKISEAIEEKHLAELGDRVQKLPSGKLHIVKFVRFQFGDLANTSNIHKSVIKLLHNHGIAIPSSSHGHPMAMGSLSHGHPTMVGPGTVQVQDKVQKEGGVGETSRNGDPALEFKRKVNRMYGRDPEDLWSCLEDGYLAEILRRPKHLAELDAITEMKRNLSAKEDKWYARSVGDLLSKWNQFLDEARSHKKARERNLLR